MLAKQYAHSAAFKHCWRGIRNGIIIYFQQSTSVSLEIFRATSITCTENRQQAG